MKRFTTRLVGNLPVVVDITEFVKQHLADELAFEKENYGGNELTTALKMLKEVKSRSHRY